MAKPIVYIASPYSKGDPAINTHFQCQIFDELLEDGVVTPIAPLWSHFQHTLFPRKYEEWIDYDNELLHLYDACLSLNATNTRTKYEENESSGRDREVAYFKKNKIDVFENKKELYAWAKKWTGKKKYRDQ